MKRVLPRILYGLLAAGLLAATVWGFLPKPVPVDIAVIARGSLRVTVDEDGKTRIKEKYIVSAPLAGRLARINLHAGDPVEAGETLLARIEPTDPTLLDARQQVAAEARVRAAEATVLQSEAALTRAQAAMELAKSEFERAQRLVKKNAASKEEVEERQTRYRTAQADFSAAKFGQKIASFELEQARAALLRTDPENTGAADAPHFEMHSPISGRVLRVLQESSTIVQPGAQLLEVGDPLDLELEIDVLSEDAVAIKPGFDVSLEHWGGSEPLSGIVRVVEPSAFTKISALGVEEQRTNVIVDFVDPPRDRDTLGDGFRVDARITTWKGDDILIVPTGALFRHSGKWTVFTVRKGRAQLQSLELGHRNDLEAEVLRGLAEGDEVIVHPSDEIKNQTRVEAR